MVCSSEYQVISAWPELAGVINFCGVGLTTVTLHFNIGIM